MRRLGRNQPTTMRSQMQDRLQLSTARKSTVLERRQPCTYIDFKHILLYFIYDIKIHIHIINQYKSAECSMILRVKKLLGVNELVIEKGQSNEPFTRNLYFLYILFFLYLLYISNNQYWMIKHCSAIKQCNVSSIKVIIIDKFSWFELQTEDMNILNIRYWCQ